jgi:hypothetical protein
MRFESNRSLRPRAASMSTATTTAHTARYGTKYPLMLSENKLDIIRDMVTYCLVNRDEL